jgi:lipopolysaccharide exporter
MAVIAIANSMSSVGVDAALISHKKDIQYLLNSAWTFEIFRGLALFILINLISEYLGILYNESQLSEILRVMSFTFILYSLKNIGVVYLRKDLEFKGIFIYEISHLVVLTIVTLTVVLLTKSIWGIVAGYISGGVALLLATYIVHPYRPKLEFSIVKFKILFSYSKWLLMAGQLNSIVEHGVTLFVGSMFDSKTLGQYERADMFTRKTAIQMGEIIWKVGLPVLSKVSSNENDIQKTYGSMLRVVVGVFIPIMTLISIFLPDFIVLFIGPEWGVLISLIDELCILASISMLVLPSSILFQAIGLPEISFKVSLLRIFSILITIYPLVTWFDIHGVVYSLMIGAVLSILMLLNNTRAYTRITHTMQLKIALPSIVSSLILIYIFSNVELFNSIGIIVNLLGAVALYLILLYCLSNDYRKIFHNFVKMTLGKL